MQIVHGSILLAGAVNTEHTTQVFEVDGAVSMSVEEIAVNVDSSIFEQGEDSTILPDALNNNKNLFKESDDFNLMDLHPNKSADTTSPTLQSSIPEIPALSEPVHSCLASCVLQGSESGDDISNNIDITNTSIIEHEEDFAKGSDALDCQNKILEVTISSDEFVDTKELCKTTLKQNLENGISRMSDRIGDESIETITLASIAYGQNLSDEHKIEAVLLAASPYKPNMCDDEKLARSPLHISCPDENEELYSSWTDDNHIREIIDNSNNAETINYQRHQNTGLEGDANARKNLFQMPLNIYRRDSDEKVDIRSADINKNYEKKQEDFNINCELTLNEQTYEDLVPSEELSNSLMTRFDITVPKRFMNRELCDKNKMFTKEVSKYPHCVARLQKTDVKDVEVIIRFATVKIGTEGCMICYEEFRYKVNWTGEQCLKTITLYAADGFYVYRTTPTSMYTAEYCVFAVFDDPMFSCSSLPEPDLHRIVAIHRRTDEDNHIHQLNATGRRISRIHVTSCSEGTVSTYTEESNTFCRENDYGHNEPCSIDDSCQVIFPPRIERRVTHPHCRPERETRKGVGQCLDQHQANKTSGAKINNQDSDSKEFTASSMQDIDSGERNEGRDSSLGISVARTAIQTDSFEINKQNGNTSREEQPQPISEKQTSLKSREAPKNEVIVSDRHKESDNINGEHTYQATFPPLLYHKLHIDDTSQRPSSFTRKIFPKGATRFEHDLILEEELNGSLTKSLLQDGSPSEIYRNDSGEKPELESVMLNREPLFDTGTEERTDQITDPRQLSQIFQSEHSCNSNVQTADCRANVTKPPRFSSNTSGSQPNDPMLVQTNVEGVSRLASSQRIEELLQSDVCKKVLDEGYKRPDVARAIEWLLKGNGNLTQLNIIEALRSLGMRPRSKNPGWKTQYDDKI